MLIIVNSIYANNPPNTIAVIGYWSDIENEETRATIQYGIPDYLNDYFYYHSNLQIADRVYINEISKEILLTQSDSFDESTYIEKGKQLKVRYLVFGYGVIAEGSSDIQTITRIYDFHTNSSFGPVKVSKSRINEIGPELAENISTLLNLNESAQEEKFSKLWNTDESALKNYSMGLMYEISGDIVKSDNYMKEALRTSGSFFKAVQKSQYYHNYLNKIFDSSCTLKYTPFIFGHIIDIEDTTKAGEDTSKTGFSSFGGNMIRLSWRGRSSLTQFFDLSIGIGAISTYNDSHPFVITIGSCWGKVNPSWYLNKYHGPNLDLLTYFSSKRGNLLSLICGYMYGLELFPSAKSRTGFYTEISPNVLIGIKTTRKFRLDDFYLGGGVEINLGLAYRYGGL